MRPGRSRRIPAKASAGRCRLPDETLFTCPDRMRPDARLPLPRLPAAKKRAMENLHPAALYFFTHYRSNHSFFLDDILLMASFPSSCRLRDVDRREKSHEMRERERSLYVRDDRGESTEIKGTTLLCHFDRREKSHRCGEKEISLCVRDDRGESTEIKGTTLLCHFDRREKSHGCGEKEISLCVRDDRGESTEIKGTTLLCHFDRREKSHRCGEKEISLCVRDDRGESTEIKGTTLLCHFDRNLMREKSHRSVKKRDLSLRSR
jgi:RNase P/RNase MRP subunit p29